MFFVLFLVMILISSRKDYMLNLAVFYLVESRILMEFYWYFGGACCFHAQDEHILFATKNMDFPFFLLTRNYFVYATLLLI